MDCIQDVLEWREIVPRISTRRVPVIADRRQSFRRYITRISGLDEIATEDAESGSGPRDVLVEVIEPCPRLLRREEAGHVEDLAPMPKIEAFPLPHALGRVELRRARRRRCRVGVRRQFAHQAVHVSPPPELLRRRRRSRRLAESRAL